MPDTGALDEDTWRRQSLGGILGGALVAGGGAPQQQTAPQASGGAAGGAVQPNAGLPATPNPTADADWYKQASNWARNRFGGDDWQSIDLSRPGNLVSSRVNLLLSQPPGLDPEFDALMGKMRSSGANWGAFMGNGGGGGGYSNMPSIPGIDPALMSQMVAGMTEGSGPGSYNPFTGSGDRGARYFAALGGGAPQQQSGGASSLAAAPTPLTPWIKPPGLMG